MSDTLAAKLEKACKCSKKLAPGLHEDTCSFHPQRLKEMMKRVTQDRESMLKQLSRTSLSPLQKEAALTTLFGPKQGAPGCAYGCSRGRARAWQQPWARRAMDSFGQRSDGRSDHSCLCGALVGPQRSLWGVTPWDPTPHVTSWGLGASCASLGYTGEGLRPPIWSPDRS